MDEETKQNETDGKDTIDWKAKAEEYLNNWKRAQADLVNYKKDEMQRIKDLIQFGNEGLILEILDPVSNLELARQHINDPGIGQIVRQFEDLLKKYGVERIAVAGQKFDPAVHEAVDEIDHGKPLFEVRPGYQMHGKVIRSARVKNG